MHNLCWRFHESNRSGKLINTRRDENVSYRSLSCFFFLQVYVCDIQVHEGDERLVATVYPNVDCAFIVTLIFIFDLINMAGTGV